LAPLSASSIGRALQKTLAGVVAARESQAERLAVRHLGLVSAGILSGRGLIDFPAHGVAFDLVPIGGNRARLTDLMGAATCN